MNATRLRIPAIRDWWFHWLLHVLQVESSKIYYWHPHQLIREPKWIKMSFYMTFTKMNTCMTWAGKAFVSKTFRCVKIPGTWLSAVEHPDPWFIEHTPCRNNHRQSNYCHCRGCALCRLCDRIIACLYWYLMDTRGSVAAFFRIGPSLYQTLVPVLRVLHARFFLGMWHGFLLQ